MARPEKDSCDFFFTNTKLFYDSGTTKETKNLRNSVVLGRKIAYFEYKS